MRKLILLAMVAMIATVGGGFIGPGRSATAATKTVCAVGCDHTTIQAAINAAAAGDTISVAAGTYAEQITINKALTVTGDDGAVLDGSGLPAGWTTGVKIKSGNVTFNNIDVTNFTQDGIVAYKNASMPNIHITNSKISNIQPGYWGFGIYVGFESEGFWSGWYSPLTTHLDFSGLLIEGNEITNTHSSALVLQSIKGTNMQVKNNYIHDNTTNDGIWVDSARNLLIEDNIIVDNLWGINFTSIPEAYSYPSYYPVNEPNKEDGPYGPKDVVVRGNTISGNIVHGIGVYEAWPSTITVTRNSIDGNGAGIDNKNDGTLNATCNWYGAANGPSGVGPGSGDSVTANVTFTPWLTSSDLNGPCRGGLVITKNQCKNGGWATFFPAALFKNQGDCVSYVATKGKN